MSVPTDRTSFKEWVLRALGDPVLQINVDDTQVEDRIDEALYIYRENHMDAIYKNYLYHAVTASKMTFAAPFTGSFIFDETIIGQTTNTHGNYVSTLDANTITFYGREDGMHFADGETVIGLSSGASGTIITSNANASVFGTVLGEQDNRYIDLPSSIISVTKVWPTYTQAGTNDILFDPQNQFNMSLMTNFTHNSLIPYVMGRQYQQLVQETLRGRPLIRYQRHMNRLFLDMSFVSNLRPGRFVVIECYQIIDEATFPDIWTDRWLQRYAIALVKRQWGMNLSKFNGIALPGGVTLDGVRMLTEANQEVKDLEEELRNTYQLPPDMMIG